MIVPENKIEEIRSAVNIVDIISEYIPLRKRGKNFIGLCPFHNEKTPSFTVSPDKQMYKCFGCSAGGNVFGFLMQYENISFVESVQHLAKKAGIVLEVESSAPREGQSELEVFYDINTAAARFFSSNLYENNQGEPAREYFRNRGIKVQTQRAFGLGYSLPLWDGFVNHAKAGNIDLEKAVTLGLVDRKDKGGYYDKFRGRIMFPIFSANGRVIAFGGRIMTGEQNTAKYLNSPESVIYIKRRTLYGLFHSKEEIRRLDKAILVEGYMDLISLYQAGVKNVVATCGTALTDEQVRVLSRYTRKIVVFYDSDNAGIKASLRSIEILLKQDFDVRIAELPAGEDPDSYVNKYGKEGIDEAIKRSLNFLDYQTSQYEKQGLINDPAAHAGMIRELVETASFVSDELKRTLLLKNISKKYGIREKLLETELENILKSAKTDNRRTSVSHQAETLPGRQEPVRISSEGLDENVSESHSKMAPSEKDIIKLLFQGEFKVIDYIFNHLTPEDFSIPAYQYLAELVYEVYVNKGDILPAALIDKIEDTRIKDYVLKLTIDRYHISKTWDTVNPGLPDSHTLVKYARDSVRKFRIFRIDNEIEQNHQRLQRARDENEMIELMKTNKQLQEEKKLIQN